MKRNLAIIRKMEINYGYKKMVVLAAVGKECVTCDTFIHTGEFFPFSVQKWEEVKSGDFRKDGAI